MFVELLPLSVQAVDWFRLLPPCLLIEDLIVLVLIMSDTLATCLLS